MANENVEIARRAYAAYNRSGIEGILGYLDPEIEWWMWEEFARGSNPLGTHARYLAEGSAGSFFTTRIAIANPGDIQANVAVRFELAFARSPGPDAAVGALGGFRYSVGAIVGPALGGVLIAAFGLKGAYLFDFFTFFFFWK